MAKASPGWKRLLASWDRQQEAFNPEREAKFSLMFDVLEAELPRRFIALDLGSGPGSVSARLLRRFPSARAIAVDLDPVVLRIGREALGSVGGRLVWVEGDLGHPGWTRSLPQAHVDAALSTTALHWLDPPRLRRLYRDLHRLLRPGGVFLNADYLPWDAAQEGLSALARRVLALRRGHRSLGSEWAPWREWWREVEREPALQTELRVRKGRFANRHPSSEHTSIEEHERALRRAGFREVGVVWEEFEDRLLFARRGRG